MTIDTETFEIEAGRVAEELARRGVGRYRIVRVTVEEDDGFSRARAASRAAVEAAGLSDEDIDHLIEEAREEVWQEQQQACASSSTRTS